MQSDLPREVLRQPKAGFAAPIDYWLAHELKEMTSDLLSESQVRRRGLFAPHIVGELMAQHRSGRHDWSMQIWQLLTLELWMQVFVDGREQQVPDDWHSVRPMSQAKAVGVHVS